jgi:hypothetical protein
MKYLRDNNYRTYIVTGRDQDFVRTYGQKVYGIPPERIVGSALDTQYQYNKAGQGILMRDPKLLLNNNGVGKAEDIYLFTEARLEADFCVGEVMLHRASVSPCVRIRGSRKGLSLCSVLS